MPEEKKRRLRPSQTVRERAEKAIVTTGKKPRRRLRTTTRVVSKPFKLLRVFRFIVPPYFRNSWRELRQVTWPNRKQTLQLTLAVFIFAIIFGLMVTITDYGLDKIFRKVLIK